MTDHEKGLVYQAQTRYWAFIHSQVRKQLDHSNQQSYPCHAHIAWEMFPDGCVACHKDYQVGYNRVLFIFNVSRWIIERNSYLFKHKNNRITKTSFPSILNNCLIRSIELDKFFCLFLSLKSLISFMNEIVHLMSSSNRLDVGGCVGYPESTIILLYHARVT